MQPIYIKTGENNSHQFIAMFELWSLEAIVNNALVAVLLDYKYDFIAFLLCNSNSNIKLIFGFDLFVLVGGDNHFNFIFVEYAFLYS